MSSFVYPVGNCYMRFNSIIHSSSRVLCTVGIFQRFKSRDIEQLPYIQYVKYTHQIWASLCVVVLLLASLLTHSRGSSSPPLSYLVLILYTVYRSRSSSVSLFFCGWPARQQRQREQSAASRDPSPNRSTYSFQFFNS